MGGRGKHGHAITMSETIVGSDSGIQVRVSTCLLLACQPLLARARSKGVSTSSVTCAGRQPTKCQVLYTGILQQQCVFIIGRNSVRQYQYGIFGGQCWRHCSILINISRFWCLKHGAILSTFGFWYCEYARALIFANFGYFFAHISSYAHRSRKR